MKSKARLGRRAFLGLTTAALVNGVTRQSAKGLPNVVIILADDLGFGDLSCFGSAISTPNLDAMAAEGMKLTRFYSASPVCSPSRAALLTGRYPVRSGVVNVLLPDADGGLKETEQTLPKLMKQRGYRVGCIGKWHLGTKKGYQPNQNGFDEFYGVPYSNDMHPLPFLADGQVDEPAAKQNILTERFTRKAVEFISKHREKPFFLYIAHTAPHIPLMPSEKWKGKSGQGLYGDVVAELDWSVGQVLDAIKANGLDDNTLVIFTSDNGPWYQGSAGNLQGRKGSTFEGGMRVPCIVRFPGKIPPGSVSQALGSTMDIAATLSGIAGTSPAVPYDGVNLWPVLAGEAACVDRDPLLFFDGFDIQCIRWGPWKLHVARHNGAAWAMEPSGGRQNLPLPQPELYHIDTDPAEAYDRAPDNQEVVRSLIARTEQMMTGMPDFVGACWRETMRKRVQSTPVGALPRPDGN